MSDLFELFPTPVLRVPRLLDDSGLRAFRQRFAPAAGQLNHHSGELSHSQILAADADPLLADLSARLTPHLAEFGAHLFGHPGGRKQAEADHCREELLDQRMGLLEGIAEFNREQFRQYEIPDEQLNEQRDVAEDFDVGCGDPGQPAIWNGTQDTDDRTDDQRNHPGAQREHQRPFQAFAEPGEVGAFAGGAGLQEDLPVPVVGHRTTSGESAAPCSAPQTVDHGDRFTRKLCRSDSCKPLSFHPTKAWPDSGPSAESGS